MSIRNNAVNGAAKAAPAALGFERAKKTFLGFLQVRGKSQNTLKNYACDLKTFGDFCNDSSYDFQSLGLPELEAYHASLKKNGLRPNSRRRKIMTAKTFLRYLSNRMDVSTIGSEKVIPPDKVEKPPKLVPREKVFEIVQAQPATDIGHRNKALIGVLLETGMLVSEALALRFEDFNPESRILLVMGKRARAVSVSVETASALSELKVRLEVSKGASARYFFYGYSKSGPNAERMTSRGVELLFKAWARSFGLKRFHPRTLRHLFVMEMFLQGKSQAEIMQLLGFKTPYAFRVYRVLWEENKPAALEPTSAVESESQPLPNR
jgi:integrase/recombinase XerD